jgi:hypothetical protein
MCFMLHELTCVYVVIDVSLSSMRHFHLNRVATGLVLPSNQQSTENALIKRLVARVILSPAGHCIRRPQHGQGLLAMSDQVLGDPEVRATSCLNRTAYRGRVWVPAGLVLSRRRDLQSGCHDRAVVVSPLLSFLSFRLSALLAFTRNSINF